MSTAITKRCGCCMDAADHTPRTIENRPALSAIRYRVGDFTSFRRTMLESIADQPELAAWTARDETDYGIALIDMWAYLGDVLTFYQERIANEAFLRTASHRESVMRLAALLDYRPSPGAAAVAYVAFFLDRGKTLQLPIGLRLQSIPGQNEKPQKFETVEAIAADAALNELRIHGIPSNFNPFAKGSTGGPLSGSVTVTAEAPIVVFDPDGLEMKSITSLDDELVWSPTIARNGLSPITTRAAAAGRRFALFGSDTPAKTMVHALIKEPAGIEYTERLTRYSITNPSRLALDRAVPDIKAGSRVLVVGADPAAVRMTTVVSAETKPQTMSTTGGETLDAYGANTTELMLGMAVTSRPAAAVKGNALDVYVVADDGAIWTRRRTNGWNEWSSIGGTSFTHVAAAGATVVARDANGTLHWRASSWLELGHGYDLIEMGIAQNAAFLVARGADHTLSVRKQTVNGEWLDWQSVGSPAVDLLAVTTNAANEIEIFARNSVDHSVWTCRETAPGQWHGLSIGGVILDGGLAAAVNQNGNVEVFARGQNSAVWRNRRSAAEWTTNWSSIGGWVDRIAASRDTNGRLFLYVRGNDGRLWTSRQTGANANQWNNWSAAGSDPFDDLVIAPLHENMTRVFVDTAAGLKQRAGVDWNSLGVPMWPITDRRKVSILELTSDPFPLATLRHPDLITGGPVAIPLSELASIDKNRTIVLDDAAQNAHVATVASSSVEGEHLLVSFTPGLTRALDGRSAVLLGNVAKVTHGETVAAEAIGSGDASSRFQTFALKKTPVTHVPQPGARNGVASTLELRVDNVRWHEAETLLGRNASERIFTTSIDEDQRMTVQFGGDPGARLPTGRNNVTAKYRVGLGAEGNVKAGAIANLLDRPVGLKGARNPARAEGGAAAETLDLIRSNAPNTVRTFSRIVSLRDFEDAAREHATVAKARATWAIEDYERVVSLTVAAEAGAVLSETALASIAADLDAKRDANKPMRIRSHTNVAFTVDAVLQVDADYLLANVQAAAETALAAFFAFDGRELGQPIHLSEVYAVLQAVPGVVAVRIETLRKKEDLLVQVGDHIRLQPYEIATLAIADRTITPQFEVLG